MLDIPETVAEVRPVSPSAMLAAKLASLRRKHVTTAALTGGAIALGVSVELLALAMFLDWWVELPWGVRLLSLLMQVAILTFITLRLIVAPLVYQPDDDELALMVERARPEFRSRLIASIQLARPGAVPPGASASLVDATVEETEAIAMPVDFTGIRSIDKLKKLGAVALSISVLG